MDFKTSFFKGADSALLVYFFLLISLGAFSLVLILTPCMMKSQNFFFLGFASLTYKIMADANVCHQLPERTLSVGGILMAVCLRDFAIFSGGFLGLGLSFFRTPRFLLSKYFLACAALPIAADGVTQTILRLRESDHLSRFATGFLLGFAFAHFLGKKTLEERKSTDYKRHLKLAFAIFFFLFLLFSIPASGLGLFSRSRSYALHASQQISQIKNPVFTETYFLLPKSAFSVPLDPFLGNYDDAVLEDLVRLKERPGFGMWVVVILEEKPRHEGKHVFLSGGRGEYYYVDAFSGRIIMKVQR